MATTMQTQYQNAAPVYSVFDANAVGVATLLGTPAAGAGLMALNYRRLGEPSKAVITFAAGLLVTALAIAFCWQLPHSVTTPLALVLLLATRKLAQMLQGKTISERVQQGARLGSPGVALAIGAAFLVGLVGIVYAAETLSESKVTVGVKDEVYYSGSATSEDASTLGKRLKQIGYLTDRGVSVLLDRTGDRKTVSFIVKQGVWADPETVASFDEIGRQLGASEGFPLTLRLLDRERDVKAESVIGKLDVDGQDTVYYYGAATPAQAQALGKALQADGFFTGKGSDVFLSRHNGPVSVSFVVHEGVWSKPASVEAFQKIVHDAAPAVGGVPIQFQLLNTSLKVEEANIVR